jgi:hypothetical protein
VAPRRLMALRSSTSWAAFPTTAGRRRTLIVVGVDPVVSPGRVL